MHAAALYTSVKAMTPWEKVVGCVGWLVATFGPITVSVIFWRLSKHLQRALVLHLLMLPIAYALTRAGAWLMLYVIGVPDFDDTIGGPIVQAFLLFVVAVIGYYFAVLYYAFNKPPKHSDGQLRDIFR